MYSDKDTPYARRPKAERTAEQAMLENINEIDRLMDELRKYKHSLECPIRDGKPVNWGHVTPFADLKNALRRALNKED